MLYRCHSFTCILIKFFVRSNDSTIFINKCMIYSFKKEKKKRQQHPNHLKFQSHTIKHLPNFTKKTLDLLPEILSLFIDRNDQHRRTLYAIKILRSFSYGKYFKEINSSACLFMDISVRNALFRL